MAINKSLLNNSDSIENIQQSLNSFGASLRAANSTSSVVIRKFYDANRKKKEVAEIIKEKFLPEIKLKYIGKDEDLRSYRVDFSKIEKTLNFKLEKTLEDAIEELIYSLKNKIYTDPNNSKYKN